MEITAHSTEETRDLAYKLAKRLKSGNVIGLYGDLGSGKTTFTKYLAEALGMDSRVQSPTFVIARRYTASDGDINAVNHVDLYRLITLEELNDLGLEEFFSEEGTITVIEWPELAEEVLPVDVIRIRFRYIDENSREIKVEG